MRGEWEVEVLALEVVLTCTEMPSPCQVAGREEPRRRPHLLGRRDRGHDGRRRARPGNSEGRGGLRWVPHASPVGGSGRLLPRFVAISREVSPDTGCSASQFGSSLEYKACPLDHELG